MRTVGSLYRHTRRERCHFVPFIRLSGKQLARAGFAMGAHYVCEISAGKIELRAVVQMPALLPDPEFARVTARLDAALHPS